MSYKIKSGREFRKGRVLMNADTDLLLVHSPSPRVWIGIEVKDGVPPKVVSRSTAQLTKEYDSVSVSGMRWPLDDTSWKPVTAALHTAHGIKSIEWRVSYVSRRKGMYTPPPALVSSKSVVSSEDHKGGEAEADATISAATKKRESVFTLPKADAIPYWYESERDRKLTRDFIALRKAEFTVNLMIAGPSGAGKTVGVQKLGEELGIPVHIVNCQAITTPEKWLGTMMVDPAKGTYFEPSQHIQWVERTHPDCDGASECILLYDEITRLRPELNNMTYSLFDTQRGLEVPQMGRRVMMDKNNLIIATANIGAAFAGTFGQDRAFRERFAMTMERDFPPMNEEIKILTSATGIRSSDANALVQIADSSRSLWKNATIEQPISTRTLVTWALLVAGGYPIITAAEYTVLPLYSEDGGVESDRAKIRLEIERKSK